jgi:hypothetical protein
MIYDWTPLSHLLLYLYSAMGTAALLLQIVPVANVLFAFSNAAGAALYAADLERGTNSLDEDVKKQ